jgi:hypothetical protein
MRSYKECFLTTAQLPESVYKMAAYVGYSPKKVKGVNKRMRDVMITEEAPGYYHYHISYVEDYIRPVCGKDMITMWTHIPMNTWGCKGHLKEKYCKECKEIYDKMIGDV